VVRVVVEEGRYAADREQPKSIFWWLPLVKERYTRKEAQIKALPVRFWVLKMHYFKIIAAKIHGFKEHLDHMSPASSKLIRRKGTQ